MRSGLGVPMLCLLGAVVWTIGNLPLFTAVVLAAAVAGPSRRRARRARGRVPSAP